MGLLGGILKVGASLLGGNSSSKASKRAAEAQLEAQRIATDEQRRQFDLTRSDNMPWLTAGSQALGGQLDLLGLGEQGASGQTAALNALREGPLFSALYDNGEEALLANASATGGLRGGNTELGLANFGRDTFAQVLENMFAKLGGLSGAGQQQGQYLGQMGQQSADNIGNLALQGGNSRAQNFLTQGRIQSNMWDTIGSELGGFGGFKLGGIKF